MLEKANLNYPKNNCPDKKQCVNVSENINNQPVNFTFLYDDITSGETIYADLETNEEIEDLYVSEQSNGLNVSITNNLDGTFSASINTPGIQGEYSITFDSFSYPSSGEGIANVYIFSDGEYDCISSASLDDAHSKYYVSHVASSEDLVLLGIEEAPSNFASTKTRYEAETVYAQSVYDGEDIVSSQVVRSVYLSNKIRVKGTIAWYDENNQPHPLKGTHLRIYDYDSLLWSDFLGGTETDSNGYFSYYVDEQTFFEIGGRDIYVTLFTKNRACMVNSDIRQYSYSTPLYSDIQINHEIEYTIEIHPGLSDRADAFEVSQAALIPHDYVYNMSQTVIPCIYILYPAINGGCYYNHILDYIGIGKGYYKFWDPICHEFGHYICDYFSLCDLSVGGHHNLGWDLILKKGEIDGTKMAMSEGLATYLGIASHLYFGNSSIPTVGDKLYTFKNNSTINFGLYNYGETADPFGEGNESSVTSLLIKLLDGGVPLGHQAMWDIICSNQHDNISSLIVDVLSAYPSSKSEIGFLLEKENFSAVLSCSSTIFSTNPNSSCWSFSWYNSTTAVGRSNLFNLVFRGNGSSYQINNIHGNSKSLSNAQINSVLALPGNTVECYVVGYLDGYPSIGGYVSSFKTISKPLCTSVTINNSYSAYLNYGENEWFRFTAPETATYHFESSGSVDTIGEVFSSMVIDNFTDGRLAYDDNSGSYNNFKVSIALNTNQTVYLRVTGATPINQGSYSVNVSLTHSSHTYHYSYSQYSSLQHKAYCSCGLYTLEAHAADYSRSYNLQGHHYAPCLYCGTVLELGGGGNNPYIPLPGSTNQMVTDNGSYIMPNGIYVIMEKDLEAFINGTLVFHPIGDELD